MRSDMATVDASLPVKSATEKHNSSSSCSHPPSHDKQTRQHQTTENGLTSAVIAPSDFLPSASQSPTIQINGLPRDLQQPRTGSRGPSRSGSPAPNRPAAAASLTLDTRAASTMGAAGMRPLVVCGPAGVGKGTLVGRLLKEFPHHFAKSVSHTTRKPREGEVHGIHYHFTTSAELLKEVGEGKFIEHANVHGNYYGTSVGSVQVVSSGGRICILEIDVQGASSVKAAALSPVTMFVRPPSMQDLEHRMRKRGSETEDSLLKRLRTAETEMTFLESNPEFFDCIILNDDVEYAYTFMLKHLKHKYPHLPIEEDSPVDVLSPATTITKSPHLNAPIANQRPLVICGPSGVGKGTLLNRLLHEYPHVFQRSISHTTRPPRANEIHGVHYHFTTVAELLQSVSEGKFVEHANVHGNFYGTSIAAVNAVVRTGNICLLEIDIQGAMSVKSNPGLKDPNFIFIRAPTFDDLEQRLARRGTESADTMQKRLETARKEMDFFYTNRQLWDADIINGELDESYTALVDTLKRLYPTVKFEPHYPYHTRHHSHAHLHEPPTSTQLLRSHSHPQPQSQTQHQPAGVDLAASSHAGAALSSLPSAVSSSNLTQPVAESLADSAVALNLSPPPVSL